MAIRLLKCHTEKKLLSEMIFLLATLKIFVPKAHTNARFFLPKYFAGELFDFFEPARRVFFPK